MKAGQLIESKYLKKDDAGEGLLATIRSLKKENVGREDEQEIKWVIHFDECKPLVLNGTNIALIEKALGTDETDDWIGKQIVLYNDENVSFGGKVTGGVRVDVNRTKRYHAKSQPKQEPIPQGKPPANFDDFKDDVPFR